MSTLERYDDVIFAHQYELSEGDQSHRGDIERYVEAFRNLGGPVLELGCGTGRISIPLAKAGLEVVGLDNAAAVVDIARRKAEEAGLAVDFQVGDAVNAQLGRSFAGAFMAYNTISLVENERVEALAKNVAVHLRPGGHFLFDLTRATKAHFDPDGCRRIPWSAPVEIVPAGVTLRRRMELRLRQEAECIDTVYFWEITHPDGRIEERTTIMPFSTWEPERYVDLFEAAGYTTHRFDKHTSPVNGRPRTDVFADLLWTGA